MKRGSTKKAEKGQREITCLEAFRSLYPFLDGEFGSERNREIQRHLDRCRACCTKFEFEKALKSLIQEKAREAEVPLHLRQRIASFNRGLLGLRGEGAELNER